MKPADPEMDEEATTEDAFHRGAFHALQPRERGHRSGQDALLIASCLPEGASGRLADLGSGAGVAGLAALAMNPGLEVTLVEKNRVMAELARKTVLLPANALFRSRAVVLEADVTLTGTQRESAGLHPDSFDHVIMNPPYNHKAQRVSPDPMRAEAHMLGASGLEPWMRTAAAILRPGGTLAMIYRPEKLADVLACAQGRFGGLAVVPVHARQDEPAGRILVRMVKGSRAPLSIQPSLVMHDDANRPTAMGDALVNGRARVHFA